MRCTKLLVTGALGLAMMAAPLWAQTTEAPPAEPKLQVKGETQITRPELQTLAGVRGWRVNGEEISLGAVQDLGLLYSGPYLLQDLVIQKLLEQAAKREAVTVSDAEVEAKMAQVREEGGLKDPEAFDRFLRGQRVTPEGYRASARILTYAEKVIGKSVYVSDEEIEKLYNAERETAYRRPEMLTYRLALTLDQKAAQASVAELKKGASFPEVAKRLVDRVEDKAVAGEEMIYAKGQKQLQYPPELEKALFAAPLSQVVGPMQIKGSPYYIFFRVEKKSDARQFTLPEVRDTIRERLRRTKIEQAWPKWLETQLATAEITPLKAP